MKVYIVIHDSGDGVSHLPAAYSTREAAETAITEQMNEFDTERCEYALQELDVVEPLEFDDAELNALDTELT